METINKESPTAILHTDKIDIGLIQILERYYNVIIGQAENSGIVIELYKK